MRYFRQDAWYWQQSDNEPVPNVPRMKEVSEQEFLEWYGPWITRNAAMARRNKEPA